jgi:hypothetical protein
MVGGYVLRETKLEDFLSSLLGFFRVACSMWEGYTGHNLIHSRKYGTDAVTSPVREKARS